MDPNPEFDDGLIRLGGAVLGGLMELAGKGLQNLGDSTDNSSDSNWVSAAGTLIEGLGQVLGDACREG